MPPKTLSDLTNTYIKLERCINSSTNSRDYIFYKSLLNEQELLALKDLQYIKAQDRYSTNRRANADVKSTQYEKLTSKNQILHDIDESNTTTSDNLHDDEIETTIVKTEGDMNQ